MMPRYSILIIITVFSIISTETKTQDLIPSEAKKAIATKINEAINQSSDTIFLSTSTLIHEIKTIATQHHLPTTTLIAYAQKKVKKAAPSGNGNRLIRIGVLGLMTLGGYTMMSSLVDGSQWATMYKNNVTIPLSTQLFYSFFNDDSLAAYYTLLKTITNLKIFQKESYDSQLTLIFLDGLSNMLFNLTKLSCVMPPAYVVSQPLINVLSQVIGGSDYTKKRERLTALSTLLDHYNQTYNRQN